MNGAVEWPPVAGSSRSSESNVHALGIAQKRPRTLRLESVGRRDVRHWRMSRSERRNHVLRELHQIRFGLRYHGRKRASAVVILRPHDTLDFGHETIDFVDGVVEMRRDPNPGTGAIVDKIVQ